MSVSWEALTEDIERAAPRRGERTSWAFYELISAAHRHAENKWSRVPALRPDGQAEGPGPAPGFEPGSQHIVTARDKEMTVMAKPKPPPPKGRVPSKTGAKHDANVIRTANSKGKLDGLGKHAKPGGKK